MTGDRPAHRVVRSTTEVLVPMPAAAVRSLLARPDVIGRWEPWTGEVVERDGVIEGATRSAAPGGQRIDVPEDRRRQIIERYADGAVQGWRFSHPDADLPNGRLITFAARSVAGGTRLRITVGWEVRAVRPAGVAGALSWGVARALYALQARQVVAGVRRALR